MELTPLRLAGRRRGVEAARRALTLTPALTLTLTPTLTLTLTLQIHVDVEVRGLFAQLTSYGEHKPADILEPASALGGDKPRALDLAITDPTSKSSLDTSSHTTALKAAHNRHTEKMGTFRRAEASAGGAGLSFSKLPIVFETTGAMGEETKKWWDQMMVIASETANGCHLSRRARGLEHTWSANSWSSYWLQRISMAHARHQAESLIQRIGANQPHSVYAN